MARKKQTENKKVGRPPKYKKEYAEQAKKLMAKHGYTMEELADFFAVVPSTLYKWQDENEELKEAIKEGRYAFDTDRVENALLKTALGFETEEEHITTDREGKVKETKLVHKRVAGNPLAQKFWLQNRDPDRWKDKQEISLPENETLVPFGVIVAGVDKSDD